MTGIAGADCFGGIDREVAGDDRKKTGFEMTDKNDFGR
jgi:hypothetical protein